jgi:hypothetical protein
MKIQYKIDFEKLAWESPIVGVKHKYIDQDNLRMRLVEYPKDMPPIGVKRDTMAISSKVKWKLNLKTPE